MPSYAFASERIVVAAMVVLIAGCVSWKPGWETVITPAGETGDGSTPLAEADAVALHADSKEAVEQALELYPQALAAAPEDPTTLVRLAEYSTLLAAAYTDGRREKARLYIEAVQYAERASSPYPWNVYFQRDARSMLDDVERYF